MKYRIGDVAKLLGITAESIRHYEEQGIITPTKSEASGYRYYGVWDLHMLIRARSYRQHGYSLAETAQLLNNCEIPDIIDSLSHKETEIEKNLIWNLNLLSHIRHLQEMIADAYATVDKYRIEYRPPMYRIDGQAGYKLHPDSRRRALYHAWIDKAPFVFPSALFNKNSVLQKNDPKFSMGLGIDEQYAGLLDVKESGDVAYFPPRLSVHTTYLSRSGVTLAPHLLTPAIEYMHSQGLSLQGDVVSRIPLMHKIGDEYFSWHQLWFPIE